MSPAPALALLEPIVMPASIWVLAAGLRGLVHTGWTVQGAPWLYSGDSPSLGKVSIARFELTTLTLLTSLAT